MERVWIVTNPGSGSTSDAKCEALVALIEERGVAIAGRTFFPADALPTPDRLRDDDVDTVVLFAGDGTINAAACALDAFGGEVLILPGGTMNLLAKRLHGDRPAEEIVHQAHLRPASSTLPFVEAGAHRAFIATIIGPVATWGRAREAMRERRIRRMANAARLAWRRSFGRRIAVFGARTLEGRHQALIVTPGATLLDAATIDARHVNAIARLGVTWLASDWRTATGVRTAAAPRLIVAAHRPVDALFDGEPVTLPHRTTIRPGRTRLRFVTTVEAALEPA